MIVGQLVAPALLAARGPQPVDHLDELPTREERDELREQVPIRLLELTPFRPGRPVPLPVANEITSRACARASSTMARKMGSGSSWNRIIGPLASTSVVRGAYRQAWPRSRTRGHPPARQASLGRTTHPARCRAGAGAAARPARPACARLPSRSHIALASFACALLRNACPAGVSSTRRFVRRNRRAPSSSSRRRICWLSGGCEM